MRTTEQKIQYIKDSIKDFNTFKKPVLIMHINLYRDIVGHVPRTEIDYDSEKIYWLVRGRALRIITSKDIDHSSIIIFDEVGKIGSITFAKT